MALQFPDELLHDSVPIYRALKTRIGEESDLYVLADTSYGRQAFVFEIHLLSWRSSSSLPLGVYQTQLLRRWSRGTTCRCRCPGSLWACMHEPVRTYLLLLGHLRCWVWGLRWHQSFYRTYRLPVIYVFGRKPIDVEHCLTTFLDNILKHLRQMKWRGHFYLRYLYTMPQFATGKIVIFPLPVRRPLSGDTSQRRRCGSATNASNSPLFKCAFATGTASLVNFHPRPSTFRD